MSTRDRRTPILSVLFKFKMLCSVFEIEYCGGKTDKKKKRPITELYIYVIPRFIYSRACITISLKWYSCTYYILIESVDAWRRFRR